MAGRLSGCLHVARLRSPHPSMRGSHSTPYANQLDMTVNPKCPSCGEEQQTVEHWLQRCPNALALRQQLFGEPSLPLSVLTTNPGSVLALAKKTLLLMPWAPCLNNNNNNNLYRMHLKPVVPSHSLLYDTLVTSRIEI